MNIFILHKNTRKCALMHCDKHVVKMILESALMLYTACWFVWYEYEEGEGKVESDLETRKLNSGLKLKDVAPRGATPIWLTGAPKTKSGSVGYRPTHYNHPCSVWVRESLENYNWLCELAWELCLEYRYRYGGQRNGYKKEKVHACEEHIAWLRDHPPPLPSLGLTEFRMAMPDEYKADNDAVQAYRSYYIGDKSGFAVWTNRPTPEWFVVEGKGKGGLTFKVKKGLTFRTSSN